MSFILDALKKSESDRQRQTGPALFEVKIAPPKPRFPFWAVAIAVLLGVNMIIVGYLLLHRSSHDEEPSASASAPAQAAAPAPIPTQPPPSAAAALAPPNVNQGSSVPPLDTSHNVEAPTGARPPAVASRAGSANTGIANDDVNEPTLAGTNSGPAPATGNPDDFAPATEPGSTSLFKGHVRRGTESGAILYQDAALVPGANLPQLRLDLHVYAAKPQDRFAMINMRKMHEGDSTPEGVKVESITPDGVLMSHNGSRFLLPRD